MLLHCRYYNETITPKFVSLSSRTWHGLIWKPISVDEMYRFLGILLRISLTPIHGGGYTAYFRDTNISIQLSNASSSTIQLPETRGFVSTIPRKLRMSLNRFKQIRGTFHPEDKLLGNGGEDKCYQLRYTMNELNAAAAATMVPEANCSFDEGGIACQSRYCPVRQYNKDKPDKCRADFFVLNDSKHYFIYHMDVYQGKNKHSAYIHKCAADLPTTQKAVMNALFKTDLSAPHPSGY